MRFFSQRHFRANYFAALALLVLIVPPEPPPSGGGAVGGYVTERRYERQLTRDDVLAATLEREDAELIVLVGVILRCF